MKNTIKISAINILLFVCLAINPQTALATKPSNETPLSTSDKATISHIESRLVEIKALNKSELSSTEKKSLRQEVREMQKKSAKISGGIFISAGAVILILVLIIILV
jgi:hypothetical protein